jgi:hypothetical protein
MSYPFIIAVPDEGLISVASMWINVVLPAPFGPNKPKISLSLIFMLILSTATISLYFFTRFFILINIIK